MFHPKGPHLGELARQFLSSTERGYDLLAPKFEYTPFCTPDSVLTVVCRYLAETGPVGSLLDICCGTGAATRKLAPVCRGQIVGLDFSHGMLEEARAKTATAPDVERVAFVRADALAMPFQETFSAAVCFGGLGHFPGKRQALLVAEVARVLAPGGRFLFVTTPRPSWRRLSFWLCKFFNTGVHLRNALVSPPFVMFYLTFCLPEVERLLQVQGFDVRVNEGLFPKPWSVLRLVDAVKN